MKFCFKCSSINEERALRRMNAEIEATLNRDKKKSRHEVKLLLLGTGQSGKSTFVKQMRLIHGNGYDEGERCSFIPSIHSNTLSAVKSLIEEMNKLAISFKDEDNVRNSELVSSQDTLAGFRLSQQVVRAIHCILEDENVQSVYLQRLECDFDSAKYFLNSLDRISSPDYIPCDEDILRVQIPTTGVEESFLRLKSTTLRIVDVGGLRGERKKWIHCFDSVASIIFIASLCDYDQLLDSLLEGPWEASMSSTSRRSSRDRITKMEVSLALFSTIVSYPGFSNTSFILFLNKKDIFEKKLVNSHLSSYYPEYTGPKLNAPSAGQFIKELFLTRSQDIAQMIGYTESKSQKVPPFRWRRSRPPSLKQPNSIDISNQCSVAPPNSANLEKRCSHSHGRYIYTHFTSATDTENMKLVFASVKDTILRRNIDTCLL